MISRRSIAPQQHNEKPGGAFRVVCWALAALLLLGSAQKLQAENVLDYLPEDALGFVLVHNLEEADKKCDQLVRIFELSLPAPLTFAKRLTGLGEGLDLKGDLLVSLIPGSDASSSPEPLVLLPVADYEKFAVSVHGDPSGEVCRVVIAGEDVLVARHGPYAMIMNVDNRETLTLLIGLEADSVDRLEPWTAWLDDNVATVAVMPPGVKKLLKLSHQGLAAQRQSFDEEFDDPEFSEVLMEMHQGIVFYQTLLDLVGTKVEMLGLGVSIDEASNVRLGWRCLLEDDLQSSAALNTPMNAPLAGYPDQPFVLAGGGTLDGTWMEALAKLSVRLMRQMPDIFGYGEFQDEHWQELEATYRDLMKTVHSVSVLMLPGETGEPLFSNLFGIEKVDNAAQYLQDSKHAVETWNRLDTLSTSDIHFQYEIRELKVGGAEACELVADVAAAARDPNVPMFNWMLEAMFGEEGKLRTLLVAADEKTVVYGMADEKRMTQVIEQVKKQEMGLQNSPQIQTTHKLLSPAAAWKFYVSPQGCVAWVKRIMDELFGQIVQQTTDIPEFGSGPPVGISLHCHGKQAELDVVWPVEGLQALADYVKKCQELQ